MELDEEMEERTTTMTMEEGLGRKWRI